ncbi:MAG: hypothetical protein IJ234_00955 [Clostridia bacterium]|nr:hypothetical protein [Clostridia bacterium]
MKLQINPVQKGDIDTVFAIQQAAYKPLFEKYRDAATNPYMESRETVLRKYTRGARLVISSCRMAAPLARSGSV